MKRYGLVLGISIWMFFGGGALLYAQAPPNLSPLQPAVEKDLFNRACALFHPDLLPAGSPYLLNHAVCGTPIVSALAANWPRLSKGTQELFARVLQRPTLPQSVISPGGHFMIHYTTTGSDAVATTDADGNGVPDYVDAVAQTYDTVWNLEVEQLGYHAPISDGDAYYDVYILNLAPQSAYGFTYPIQFPAATTASYMEIDNNYTDSIYQTKGLNGLHVTVAHEFFHAIQFAYYAMDVTWWHELTAVWMEDVAYNSVNDYYQYLPGFFQFPTASLDRWTTSADIHPFGAAVFAHYLAQVYGRISIRNTWDALKAADPTGSIVPTLNGAMPAGGFAGVMPQFVIWDYFTGTRARSGYYDEASAYPEVPVQRIIPRAGITVADSGYVDHLGSDYVDVATSGLSGTLQAQFTLSPSTTWSLQAVLVAGDHVDVLHPTGTDVSIPDVGQYTDVVFIPAVVGLTGANYPYRVTVSVAGSSSGSPAAPALSVDYPPGPIVLSGLGVGRVVVHAAGVASGTPVSWSVHQTSGALSMSVEGQSDMASFQTSADSIAVLASGRGAASLEITAEAGGSSASVMWLVLSQTVPVELASFGGEALDGHVVLSWTVASQTNNTGWRVLRSTDGKTYTTVAGWVPGAGTSDQLLSYSFTDGHPPASGDVFYMLEQVDLDGTVHRSNPVDVNLGARLEAPPAAFAVRVFPNPFNPATTVAYDLPQAETVSVVVYNVLGQPVRHLVAGAQAAGRYTARWDGLDDAGRATGSGVYLARVVAGRFSATRKMLLLK